MNKKFYIGAIVGAVASFLLGWVVYGMLLMDFFKSNTTVYAGLMKDPPVMWAIFLGGLCSAALLAWIFSKMGITTFMKGATTGLWVGFLLTAMQQLYGHAFMNLHTSALMLTDIVVSSLFYAVLGGIIAWVMGMVSKPATAPA